jgi:predicted transcriptional regulator
MPHEVRKEGTIDRIEMKGDSILEDIQEEKVVAQFNKYIQQNYLL